MAEVTGFTADRMRVIENETVVDGEVQGDNLILLTREGTPIDAGSVRGPQGIQGPAGPVQSVNDQVGAVYSPRVFATKAALDAWLAPAGAQAYTTDTKTTWNRIGTAWFPAPQTRIYANFAEMAADWTARVIGTTAIATDTKSRWMWDGIAWLSDNGNRFFTNVTERDQRWAKPPQGAQCVTDPMTEWTYLDGAWHLSNKVGYLAHIERTSAAGPVGYAPAGIKIAGLEISFSLPAQKWCEIAFYMRHWRFYGPAQDYAVVEIRNISGATVVDSVSPSIAIPGALVSGPVYMSRVLLLGAGTHMFNIWAASQISGGSAELTAYSTSPMTLSAKAL